LKRFNALEETCVPKFDLNVRSIHFKSEQFICKRDEKSLEKHVREEHSVKKVAMDMDAKIDALNAKLDNMQCVNADIKGDMATLSDYVAQLLKLLDEEKSSPLLKLLDEEKSSPLLKLLDEEKSCFIMLKPITINNHL
jgi:hypothetical protein